MRPAVRDEVIPKTIRPRYKLKSRDLSALTVDTRGPYYYLGAPSWAQQRGLYVSTVFMVTAPIVVFRRREVTWSLPTFTSQPLSSTQNKINLSSIVVVHSNSVTALNQQKLVFDTLMNSCSIIGAMNNCLLSDNK